MSGSEETINSDPMTRCDTRAVAEWLVNGARSAALPQELLRELCERLAACGVPLWRVAVFVRTLHPNVMGRRLLWRQGAPVELMEAPFELLDSAVFRDSTIAGVYAGGRAIRRRLADPDCAVDFPVLAELRAEGVTDYSASPLFFTDGAVHVATWTTRQPGGFSDPQLAGIEAVLAPLARLAEIHALRRTAGNLLDTYVGHRSGEEILAGRVRRGDIAEIHAAIWLSGAGQGGDQVRCAGAAATNLPARILCLNGRYCRSLNS